MDEEFLKWVELWDNAQAEIEKDSPPQPQQVSTSFFNDQPNNRDYRDAGEEGVDDWLGVYKRSVAFAEDDPEQILNEAGSVNIAYAGSEGYGKQNPTGKLSAGGNKVYTHNPIHFSSVGTDQESEDGHVRVTNNWSDGDELKELDEMKKKLEVMERNFHTSDVLHKKERKTIEEQLKNLRQRVKQLSEKIVSNPQKDLT